MIIRIFFVLITFGLSFYLGYHAIWGERGFQVWQERQVQMMELEKTYSQALKRRNDMAAKVKLVQREVDQDILEQLAWTLFRFVSSKKKVILFKK